MNKLYRILFYIAERMGESSTWQGIGFVIALTGSHVGAGANWAEAAGLGGMVSAIIKMIFPDKYRRRRKDDGPI